MVPTYETVARVILRDLRRRAATGSAGALLVTTAPPIATTLWTLDAPPGMRVFVSSREDVPYGEYTVSAAQENALPPGTKMLRFTNP